MKSNVLMLLCITRTASVLTCISFFSPSPCPLFLSGSVCQQVGQSKWCVGGEALSRIDGCVNGQQSHIDREDVRTRECKCSGEHRWTLFTFFLMSKHLRNLTSFSMRIKTLSLTFNSLTCCFEHLLGFWPTKKISNVPENNQAFVRINESLVTAFPSQHLGYAVREDN